MNKNKTHRLFEDTTEGTPVTRKIVQLRPRRGRIFLMGFKAAFFLTFCVAVTEGFYILLDKGVEEAQALKAQAIDYITPALVPVDTSTSEELGSLITRVSREAAIDPLILTVIAEKESAGGKFLYRFEPGKFSEISRQGKYQKLTENERRMMASSHGAFHVLGLSASHFCQLHWSKMYQPLEGARCAAQIVKTHWEDTKHIKDMGERVRVTFLRYNGSGEMAERYADDAMRKLAGLLYKDNFKRG